jgi:glycosyltransferase involved in cell wall biosynthesis
MEKFFAKRAAQIITVSDSIKEYMKSYFKNDNIDVIRNIPSYTHSGEYDLFREKFNIDKNKKICLYQGLISENRGVGLIIKAAVNIVQENDNCIFFFLGDGSYLNELKSKVTQAHMEGRIYILGSIDQQNLLKYTKSADIGIHAINNSCLNHDYCLPNKLFEYIHSGLVLMMTDLTELKKFVEENKIGLTFEDNNVKSLEKQLLKLLTDKELFEKYRENSIALANKITWDNEYQKLKTIYERVC